MKKNIQKHIKANAYTQAGVDIDRKMLAISEAKKMIKKTSTPETLSGIGLFGGLFKSPGKDEILVSSTDGVGTKLKVACMAGRHDTVGQDIVNHCVNDILVEGAQPLFFLDYIGMSSFNPEVFKQIIKGLCKACRKNQCVLIGGETAEMPGLYPPNEYDLVGTIVGSVKKSGLIIGDKIKPGNIVIALPSTGLHTNGYSLARKIIFEQCGLEINDILPGTKQRVADVLLAIHKSYLSPVKRLMKKIKINGMAHITGGGIFDNIQRILPANVSVTIDASAYHIPFLFKFLMKRGKIDIYEMYRVFNMGIGFIIIVEANLISKALQILKNTGEEPFIIGEVIQGKREVILKNANIPQ